MMATVDLVGIRPLMQATLAALFKFEMFDGVGDQQQTTPARACFKPIDEWVFRNGFRFLRFLWWMLQSDLNIFRAVAEIKVLDNLAAASAGSVFWPRQAETTKTSDIPAALDMSAQLAPLENFASMMASVISIVLIISTVTPRLRLRSGGCAGKRCRICRPPSGAHLMASYRNARNNAIVCHPARAMPRYSRPRANGQHMAPRCELLQ
jgi:hypothetical protein